MCVHQIIIKLIVLVMNLKNMCKCILVWVRNQICCASMNCEQFILFLFGGTPVHSKQFVYIPFPYQSSLFAVRNIVWPGLVTEGHSLLWWSRNVKAYWVPRNLGANKLKPICTHGNSRLKMFRALKWCLFVHFVSFLVYRIINGGHSLTI